MQFYIGASVPIPTLPETYKPFVGGTFVLPIETPPLLLIINLLCQTYQPEEDFFHPFLN